MVGTSHQRAAKPKNELGGSSSSISLASFVSLLKAELLDGYYHDRACTNQELLIFYMYRIRGSILLRHTSPFRHEARATLLIQYLFTVTPSSPAIRRQDAFYTLRTGVWSYGRAGYHQLLERVR